MLNRIILMGRLVADPELKTTTGGLSVAGFRMAVDRNYQPKEGEKQVDFIPCVAWRQTAEFIAKHFGKGPDDRRGRLPPVPELRGQGRS